MSKERTVWITGASSGIGAALARAYSARGDWVILSARRSDALEEVRRSLTHPDRALCVPLDVEAPETMAAAAEAALGFRGQIDVLINNAGITQRSTAVDTSMETCRHIMEVSFFGAVGLTQKVLPRMLEQGHGHIVMMASVAGYAATPLRSSYSAAKHAIRAWADSARAELSSKGIAFTVICPGYIATGISGRAVTDKGAAQGWVESTDDKGLDVDRAALEMLRGIDQKKDEVFVGGRELSAIWLKRFAPGLLNKLMPRLARRQAKE